MTLSINTKGLSDKLRRYIPIVIDTLMSNTRTDGLIKVYGPNIIDGLEKNIIHWNSKFSSYMYGKISSVISLTIEVIN